MRINNKRFNLIYAQKVYSNLINNIQSKFDYYYVWKFQEFSVSLQLL